MITGGRSKNYTTAEEYSLVELQQWLKYTKHSWSLGAGWIILPYGLIFLSLKIVAIVFTPYMLWHLYQAKWFKSVVMLMALVVLPFLLSQFIPFKNTVPHFMLLFLPYLNFFLFAYIISFIIGERLIKIKTLKKWEREEESYQMN